MGEDRGVLSEDEARFERFDRALGSIVGNHGAHSPHSDEVRADAVRLAAIADGVGMQALRTQAVFNAAAQPDNFVAQRIAKSYPTILNMVALVEALRVQVVIERME